MPDWVCRPRRIDAARWASIAAINDELPSVTAQSPASYARLFRVQGFGPLLGSMLLSRTALTMSTVAFVLFGLQHLHSASVAGISVFLLIFPGLVASPVNGALLDRFGRRRLMMLDFGVAASGVVLIAGLATTGRLGTGVLFLILSLVSLTSTLSAAGSRSLFPLMVPGQLWERANATDSLCYGAAAVAGPALAGLLTAALGSPVALLFVALAYFLAALAIARVPEPRVDATTSHGVFHDAWHGLRLVFGNRTLRWLAIALSVANVGWGLVLVALPVVVLQLHGSAATVGELLALQGLVGIPAALFAGRIPTDGRERGIMSASFSVLGAGTVILLLPSLVLVAIALAVIGIADGPLNIALFSLRQRRTHRSWFGRAFAISMSLNFAGAPIGSAIAGPLVTRSATLTIIGAASLPLIAALVVWRIPRTV